MEAIIRGNQWRQSVEAISGGHQWRQSEAISEIAPALDEGGKISRGHQVEAISGGNQRPSARSHLLSQPAPLRRRIPTRLLELRLRLGARRLRLAQLRL